MDNEVDAVLLHKLRRDAQRRRGQDLADVLARRDDRDALLHGAHGRALVRFDRFVRVDPNDEVDVVGHFDALAQVVHVPRMEEVSAHVGVQAQRAPLHSRVGDRVSSRVGDLVGDRLEHAPAVAAPLRDERTSIEARVDVELRVVAQSTVQEGEEVRRLRGDRPLRSGEARATEGLVRPRGNHAARLEVDARLIVTPRPVRTSPAVMNTGTSSSTSLFSVAASSTWSCMSTETWWYRAPP